MFEKIKEFFYKWCGKLNELREEGRNILALLTFLLPPVLIGLFVVLIIKAMIAGINFVRFYYAHLIFAAFGICVFVAWLDKRQAAKIDLERQEQEMRERRNYSDKLEAARTKDATYTMQAKILFSVARELGPLGIVPPATLSNIYSQGRTVPQMGGALSLNVYLLQKDCESVDTDLIQHILQTKIDQRLQAGEPGIPEQYVFRGRVYSGLAVDQVRDSMGGFVEVYTALVDDAYCRYRERRNLNSGILLPSVDRRDTEY